MFKNLILKISKSRNSLAELLRTYIVGIFNLLFGLSLNYIFQFVILVTVSFPLRTYLTNTFSFVFGVIVSYFLSRRIIFNLSFFDGTLKEFIKFVTINFINLFVPLLIWFLINLWNTDLQKNGRKL